MLIGSTVYLVTRKQLKTQFLKVGSPLRKASLTPDVVMISLLRSNGHKHYIRKDRRNAEESS